MRLSRIALDGAGPVAAMKVVDDLERGRASCAGRVWTDAYESLSRADRVTPLGADDLDLLATSAYMLGRDDDFVSALERAHQAYLDAGQPPRAARSGFWLGINLASRGEMARATDGSAVHSGCSNVKNVNASDT